MKLCFAWLVLACLLSSTFACNEDSSMKTWAAERVKSIGHGFETPCRILEGGNAARSPTPDGRKDVNLFLFQNDEKELLPDWLQYHSYLFGIKSIHVIDHNSTDPQICKLLAIYTHCGATVTNYAGEFSGKRGILSDHMHKYKPSFLIPLDTDELIVAFKKDEQGNNKEVILDREYILNEITSSPLDGRKYKFNGAHPVRHSAEKCEAALNQSTHLSASERRVMAGGYEDPTQYRPLMYKTFYYSNGFLATDQGNHFGEVMHDLGAHGTDSRVVANITHYFYSMPSVSLLHYITSSYASLKAKILRGARVYGFDDKHQCHPEEHGAHYCKLAKDFREDSEHSKKHFLHSCTRTTETGVSLMPVTNWFAKYTLSIDALVGA